MKRFDCEECINRDICKYIEEANKKALLVEDINLDAASILDIDFFCKRYKEDKQDRDYNGTSPY